MYCTVRRVLGLELAFNISLYRFDYRLGIEEQIKPKIGPEWYTKRTRVNYSTRKFNLRPFKGSETAWKVKGKSLISLQELGCLHTLDDGKVFLAPP